VADQFVGYSTVADNAHRHADVLQNTVMTEAHDTGEKLAGRIRTGLVLGLVTGPRGQFEVTQNKLAVGQVHE
jgi:hypothetical protein